MCNKKEDDSILVMSSCGYQSYSAVQEAHSLAAYSLHKRNMAK